MEDLALPSEDFGPEESWALARLAASWASEMTGAAAAADSGALWKKAWARARRSSVVSGSISGVITAAGVWVRS